MTLTPRSLRWQIQLWYGLLLGALLAGFGYTAYRLNAADQYRHLDAELRLRLQALSNRLADGGRGGERGGRGGSYGREEPPPRAGDEPPPPRWEEEGIRASGPTNTPRLGRSRLSTDEAALFSPAGYGYYYAGWTRYGGPMGASNHAPRDLPQPNPTTGNGQRTRGDYREVFLFTPPGECLLAGVSEAPLRAELRRFALMLTGLGTGVLLVGLAGGGWIATRAIGPLRTISATAQRIARGALQERIPPTPTLELAEVTGVLNETFASLERTFREQARFTSDAAHELRTPLSVIGAQAQLALARPRSVEELTETIRTIRRSADRLSALTEALLDLALLEGDPAESPPVACDLATLAEDQVEAMRPLALQQEMTLACFPGRAPCEGDPVRLAQVITNLVGNALKYCRPGDRVHVFTGTEEGLAFVRVADNGPGIAPEHFPHLFGRFYRADASRTRSTGGAGLGLAICQRIAEAHHGRITVEPTEGGGVTFVLWVPVRGAARR